MLSILRCYVEKRSDLLLKPEHSIPNQFIVFYLIHIFCLWYLPLMFSEEHIIVYALFSFKLNLSIDSKLICVSRRGLIYHVPSQRWGTIEYHRRHSLFPGELRNVINQAPSLSQQILILSRLVEDTKLKGIFLVTLTIFGKK